MKKNNRRNAMSSSLSKCYRKEQFFSFYLHNSFVSFQFYRQKRIVFFSPFISIVYSFILSNLFRINAVVGLFDFFLFHLFIFLMFFFCSSFCLVKLRQKRKKIDSRVNFLLCCCSLFEWLVHAWSINEIVPV